MPTNRTAIRRSRRPPRFSAEALALFAELEQLPARRLDQPPNREKSKRLAALLGLSESWWGGCSVTDRERAPCWPPWLVAHHDWYRVRAVREQLLEATRPKLPFCRDASS
jgi:hypothetical protein